jgi:hypothetical protein
MSGERDAGRQRRTDRRPEKRQRETRWEGKCDAQRETERALPESAFLASTDTDPAAKSVGDRTSVKDGPVEGGRPPRQKPTAERVGHDR